jgi:hypothetical protein
MVGPVDVALAVTLHDPENRLYEQARRVLPVLAEVFSAIALRPSATTNPGVLSLFAAGGAHIDFSTPPAKDGAKLGLARRAAVALALKCDAPFVLYCDCDRALHWAEHHPQELAQTAGRLTEHDFTVLGRTPRAFDTHPRVQRDTEAIINHVFGLVSGWEWDVSTGARGLARCAAEAILAGCFDENLSTDVSWPLFLRSAGGFSLGYLQTEGLEFETPDRYGREVALAGGREAWLEQFDADPQRWLERLELARGHLQAMMPYQ